MAKHAHKIVTGQAEAVARSGKLVSCNLAVSGDRIWNLREVNVSGNVIYKVDSSLTSILHMDLHLGFKTALFAEVISGTTGEMNLIYE